MSIKTGIFFQARLGSTRLPRKALLEIEGKTIITHAMQALASLEADIYALLTDEESRRELAPEAETCGFEVFAGSPDDVLNRYVSAATFFGVNTIIRATGDNPLVDAQAAAMILESHIEAGADYSGYDDMPLGTGVEVLNASALYVAERESCDPYDHEHVSPYLYKNPERFKINRITAPGMFCLPGSHVTIDTEEDYIYLKQLFSSLYSGSPLGIVEIIPWLKDNRRSV